jgi:hypothetical protein
LGEEVSGAFLCEPEVAAQAHAAHSVSATIESFGHAARRRERMGATLLKV